MNGTPRIRGAFPQTPAPKARGEAPSPTPPARQSSRTRPTLRAPAPGSAFPTRPESPPLIPLTVIDAPTQRAYIAAVYILLFAWRCWDWVQIAEDDVGSVWQFFKWVGIDFLFLFMLLPALRIPWLDLSQPVVLGVFCAHLVIDWVTMFNIQLPIFTSILGLVRIFYDRELAVSEHNVKISSILHNQSLIMGKQIINILPEGSALLNPDKKPFCVGPGQNVASVPIYFNATAPVEVELIRIDIETQRRESVKLGRSQLREIGKLAKMSEEDGLTSYTYDLPIKKPGVYQLNKVLDEYKLEVQRVSQPVYVVSCPKARVRRADPPTRCINELSDLSLEVEGTPPLKVIYSRVINGKEASFHFQSLQPDGFWSPLAGASQSSSLIPAEDEDFSWARSELVPVAVNESMNYAGDWQYMVDEVHDVFGNIVKYTDPDDLELKPKPKNIFQDLVVRERPRATLVGCDMRSPMKVAAGQEARLPVKFSLPGQEPDNTAHTMMWHFSPIDTLKRGGEHGDKVEVATYTAKHATDQPLISAPGLYTLKSIACDSCEGEIEEPSSCLLTNPMKPRLQISAEPIPDQCAGNPIGLRVNLDLVGTPPFTVYYDVVSNKNPTRIERVIVQGVRQQIDLKPQKSGTYYYRFYRVEDKIYDLQLPSDEGYYLMQTVKPPATAYFENDPQIMDACLGQQVTAEVHLLGDAPFSLEYELVHNGRRKLQKAWNITSSQYFIYTPVLDPGGDYTLALASVEDKSGCRVHLRQDIDIKVRMQHPRAAFGLIEGRRSTTVIEDSNVKLPLRLSGIAPFRVAYRNVEGSNTSITHVARSENDFIETKERGHFEIDSIVDIRCPGLVDDKASTFDVGWYPRPDLKLVPSDSIKDLGISRVGRNYVKKEVCEGDIDGFDIALKGAAPYHVAYEVKNKPKSGSSSIAQREFDVVLPRASIPMDTANAGLYTYKFSGVEDNLYSDHKRFIPLLVEQTVNAKPFAAFDKPGHTMTLCVSEEEYDEKIPITLEGVAPFYVEVEVRHHTGIIPEVYSIPNIPSNSFGIHIPRRYLKLGTQAVRIRKVRDALGCQRKIEAGGPTVQIQLYEPPSIYPLESHTDYCVGEFISYTLSGTPPFEIEYTFEGQETKAKSTTTNFRRVAEKEGDFVITSVADKASHCRAEVNLLKTIHPLPAVRISRGRVVQVDIHEGSEVEILFEFWGTAPFEFTWTRSTNARKGQTATVLETRHDVSYERSKRIMASLEGTYEVVAIKDKHCAFSTQSVVATGNSQKKLQY